MESVVIFLISFCLTLGTPTTEIASDTVVPEASHVKSIYAAPYHAPVHVTGFAPATTILEAPIWKSHSYTTEIKHHVPVGVGAVPTAVKSAVVAPAGHLKSSLIRHEVPVVPVEVAPAPAVVPAAGPVKSIQAFSFATEVKHEVPVVAEAPVAAVAVSPAVKSIHAPAVVPQVHVAAPAPVIAPVVEAAAVPAVGPVKSSAIKAFSFATEVRHEVPVAAAPVAAAHVKSIHAPVVAAPVPAAHVKSIHAPLVAAPVPAAHVRSVHAPVVAAPVPAAHVKSVHAPVVAAPVAAAHVKSVHAPVVAAPVDAAHVKSVHAPVAAHVVAPAPAVASIAPLAAVAHAVGPVKSSAIKAFSYGTEVKHGVPVAAAPVVHAPVISNPLVSSIHAPIGVHEALPHAPAVAPATKSIHAPVFAPNHITATGPVVAHQRIVHKPITAPLVKSHSYVTALRHRIPAFGSHAPALSAAGLLGSRYSHAGHLVRRLPVSASVNHRFHGGYYGYLPRLYASMAAPGAILWGGHPVSSGVSYLGGISRGAFGYHPVPVHYQHYRSPVLGVWNYFRGG